MKLILREHVQFPSSFGILGHFITKEIMKRNWEYYVNLISQDPGPFDPSEYNFLLENAISNERFDEAALKSAVLSITTTPIARPRPAMQFLYTAWEGTVMPEFYKKTLEPVDVVFVPSDFARDAFLRGGFTEKVYTIPHGVDPNLFPIQPVSEEKFTFLSIGIDDWRKGHDVLIEAYRREFDPSEALLKIKTSAVMPVPRGVTLDSSKVPFSRMGEMYKGVHAFILATNGEGFCLPALEALASGLPVGITKATGHTEFLGSDYYPIKVGKKINRPGMDKNVFYHQPDIKSVREQMRNIYENYDKARAKALKGAARVRTSWTWANTVDAIQVVLDEYGVEL